MITHDLIEKLTEEHVEYDLVPHTRTEHAADEAAALGVSPRQVGKTLILRSDEGFVRAVLPASERLDLRRIRTHFDDRGLRLATEDELGETYADFELGAVPPFGGPGGDRVVVDRRIAELEQVTVEAGTHRESLVVRPKDLIALTHAGVADLCREE